MPKFWNSMFAAKVLNAYDNKELNYTEESIRKWFDAYNAPLKTSGADVKIIRKIIEYYEKGHDIKDRTLVAQ